MAFTTTSQVLHDGAINTVMQFTGVSDGAGQETNVVKVDASELSPAPSSLKVKKVCWDVSMGTVVLLWNANDPVVFLNATGSNGEKDYCHIGGMVNGGGVTANGDILFSTLGLEAGATYTVTIEMRKKF